MLNHMAVDLEKLSFEQADSTVASHDDGFNPSPQTTPTSSNTPNPDSIVINPLIHVIHGNTAKDTSIEDKLFAIYKALYKITNSFSSTFSSVFNWMEKLFDRLINSELINVKIKLLTAIAIAVALTVGGAVVGGVIVYLFQ